MIDDTNHTLVKGSYYYDFENKTTYNLLGKVRKTRNSLSDLDAIFIAIKNYHERLTIPDIQKKYYPLNSIDQVRHISRKPLDPEYCEGVFYIHWLHLKRPIAPQIQNLIESICLEE